MVKFTKSLVAGVSKRSLVVKSMIAAVLLATALSTTVLAAVIVKADGPHVYGANFAQNGSFYISYDYEYENDIPTQRMRVFQSGKLGLINAPVESVVWSPNTDEASLFGRFTAKGITYTLKANFVLVNGIRAAQFFVYDANSKLVGQSTLIRATVFSFKK